MRRFCTCRLTAAALRSSAPSADALSRLTNLVVTAGTPVGDAGGAYAADAEVGGEPVPGGGDGTPSGELLGEEEELDETGAYGEVPEGAAARSPTSELFTADVADEELLTAS